MGPLPTSSAFGGRVRLPVVLVGVLCLLLAFLGACTSGKPDKADDQAVRQLADDLARALEQGDVSTVPVTGTSATAASSAHRTLLRGMGPLRPAVTVLGTDVRRDDASAQLRYEWRFPGVPSAWTYEATVQMRREEQRWTVAWSPTLVHPELSDVERLSQRRRYPPRGRILGEDGDPLVEERAIVRYGIDKSEVSSVDAVTSARRLAALLDIDAEEYATSVERAGDQAFVEALVLRATADERPRLSDVNAINGALAIEGTQMLAPTRDFARSVLGTVGEATREVIEASGGRIAGGDQAGLSGLQRRYDEQLRGVPGVQVDLLVAEPSPSGSPDPSPGGPSPSPSPAPPARRTLFAVDAVLGSDLTITLNRFLQQQAEDLLADVKPASALVAVRPSTGAVLVAANGPGAKGQPLATLGQAPPGSTFKIVTALALLRAGLTPDSTVSCPRSLNVDGRRFTNYSDYPASELGAISLRTALAQSCNTAFIGQRTKVTGDRLAEAGASLGLGIDYSVGYPSYFGAIPVEARGTDLAAATIGQGTVLASPLAMATVLASVSAGETVVPHLVEGTVVQPVASPLTPDEATQLRSMLRAVVESGSGRVLADLRGPAVMAKTGTAEFGTRPPYPTHAWMVAAQGDLAVAVFVREGTSGSRTAGPLLREFLRIAR